MNKRILLTLRHYLPGFKAGGPVVSIANLVSALQRDAEFRIITTDRDLADSSPYPNLQSNAWLPHGAAHVLYLEPAKIGMARLQGITNETRPRLVYLNSFFDTRFTARMLLARRLGRFADMRFLLAPRGEFSPGALALKSKRKGVFIRALQAAGLLDGLEWHASTHFEASDIENALQIHQAEKRIFVAPDLGSVPSGEITAAWTPRLAGAPLRICFLSRISPMKNLLGAIRALGLMSQPARLMVYGPIEDQGYWSACGSEASQLPPHIEFAYGGPVLPGDVHARLAEQDVFFLPTLGENYGHVIPEALSVGLPAIISDRTPWRGLKQKGIGSDLALDDLAFAQELDLVARLSSVEQYAMRERCRHFAREVLCDPNAIAKNRRLFLGER